MNSATTERPPRPPDGDQNPDRPDSEEIDEPRNSDEHDSQVETHPDSAIGGASNEFGTVLGTGSPSQAHLDDSKERETSGMESPPADTTNHVSDLPATPETAKNPDQESGLTDTARQFLRDVIAGINGELDGYDLTQSMTAIRDAIEGEVDEEQLVEDELLEIQRVYGRKYYYVPPAGQAAVSRKIYAGRNNGDLFEKTAHKVYVEYIARHLRNRGLLVETYYEPMAGGMVFDVAAFLPRDDGSRTLAVIAEVVTNIRPELMVKHYDDLASFEGVRKMWVVPHTDVAHEIIRALSDAERLENVPHKTTKNYARLSEEAFDNPREWRFVGGRNIIESVDQAEEDSEGHDLRH
jgi:hypothetical protein